jgi:hypothetical protein
MTGTIHVTASYPNGLQLTNPSYEYVTVAPGVVIGNPSGPALYGAATITPTIANGGSITATGGYGIALAGSGAIINASGGLISGVSAGVDIVSAGTITNVGAISGGHNGVQMEGELFGTRGSDGRKPTHRAPRIAVVLGAEQLEERFDVGRNQVRSPLADLVEHLDRIVLLGGGPGTQQSDKLGNGALLGLCSQRLGELDIGLLVSAAKS